MCRRSILPAHCAGGTCDVVDGMGPMLYKVRETWPFFEDLGIMRRFRVWLAVLAPLAGVGPLAAQDGTGGPVLLQPERGLIVGPKVELQFGTPPLFDFDPAPGFGTDPVDVFIPAQDGTVFFDLDLQNQFDVAQGEVIPQQRIVLDERYLDYIDPAEREGDWLTGDNRIIANEVARVLLEAQPDAPRGAFEVQDLVEQLQGDPALRESFEPLVTEGFNLATLENRILPSTTSNTGAVRFTLDGTGVALEPMIIPEDVLQNFGAIQELGLDVLATDTGVAVRSQNLDTVRAYVETARQSGQSAEELAAQEAYLAALERLECMLIELANVSVASSNRLPGSCAPKTDDCEYRREIVALARDVEAKAVSLVGQRLSLVGSDPRLSEPTGLAGEYTSLCQGLLDPFTTQFNKARNFFLDREVLDSCQRSGTPILDKGAYGSPAPRVFPASLYTELLAELGTTVRFASTSEDVQDCTAGYLGGGYFLTAGHCFPSQGKVYRPTLSMDWDGLKARALAGCPTEDRTACEARVAADFKTLAAGFSKITVVVRGQRNTETGEFFDFAIFRLEGNTANAAETLSTVGDAIFRRIVLPQTVAVSGDATYIFSPSLQLTTSAVGSQIWKGLPLVHDGGVIRFPPQLSLIAMPKRALEVCAQAKFENGAVPGHVERRMLELASAYRVFGAGEDAVFRFTSGCNEDGEERGVCQEGDFMLALGGELDVAEGSSGAPVFAKPTALDNASVSMVGIVSNGQVGVNLQLAIGRNESFLPSSLILRNLEELSARGDAGATAVLAAIRSGR